MKPNENSLGVNIMNTVSMEEYILMTITWTNY